MLRNSPRRRAAAHACPECKKPWAVRGARLTSGSWLFSCRFCTWHDTGPVPATGEAGTGAGGSGAWSHGVHLYREDSELLGVLVDYLAQGWDEGGVGILLTTPERHDLAGDLIARRGLAPAARAGRLIQLDAEATLRLFMSNGTPDTFLFQETVGALVRQHAAGPPLRVFGELVDVLWKQGNVVGALRLEQLWSRLQQEVPFTLLCSYAREHVDLEGRDALCQAHDHVVS